MENRNDAKQKSNKEAFLEQPKGAIQMVAEELPILAREYEKKHKIKLIVNGESDYGKQQIQSHDNIWKQLADDLNQESRKYATYLKIFWHKGNKEYIISDHFPSAFADQYENLKKAISNYIKDDDYDSLKTNLNESDLQNLNEAIKNLPELKKLFDEKISVYGQQLPLNQADQCLDRDEVQNEIADIQKTLGENQKVGYFYTNNHRVVGAHFEILIITKDNVIRPVDWGIGPDKELMESNIPGKFVNSSINDFVTVKQDESKTVAVNGIKYWRGSIPKAQSSDIECGPLGLLYLKELLKHNGAQLKDYDYTLTIPYYDKDGRQQNLFFPSPQILRYSQSGGYNKVIAAMLTDTVEPVTVNHRDSIYTVTTLKKILESTHATALSKNNKPVADECTKILNLLPEFKKRWDEAFQLANKKRDTMQKEGTNRYLTYTSVKFHNKAMHSNDAYKEIVQKRIADAEAKAKALQEKTAKQAEINKSKTETLAILNDLLDEIEQLDEETFDEDNKDDARLVRHALFSVKMAGRTFDNSQNFDKFKTIIDAALENVDEQSKQNPALGALLNKYKVKTIAEEMISRVEKVQQKNQVTLK